MRQSTGEKVHRTIRTGRHVQAITFQLELVYTRRRGKRRGPFGPYWYVYFSKKRRKVDARTRVVSRYVGKPSNVNPASLSASELKAIIA